MDSEITFDSELERAWMLTSGGEGGRARGAGHEGTPMAVDVKDLTEREPLHAKLTGGANLMRSRRSCSGAPRAQDDEGDSESSGKGTCGGALERRRSAS